MTTVIKIVITFALASIAILVIVSVAIRQHSANAQPLPFEDVRPITRGADTPAICAVGNLLYVVKGNTIYQFDSGLNLIRKAQLEEELRSRPGKREDPFPPSRKR